MYTIRTYVCVYTHMCAHVYTYIYIHRYRIYIYIYISSDQGCILYTIIIGIQGLKYPPKPDNIIIHLYSKQGFIYDIYQYLIIINIQYI